MPRNIDAGNDLDVILFCAVEDLNQFISVIIIGAVGILNAGSNVLSVARITCPFGFFVAGQPTEIIAVAVRYDIAVRITPNVCVDALILGHVQLQRIITHPSHLPDQVFDPLHGPVFSRAVEHNGAFLLRVRLVLHGAGGDLHAVACVHSEMLDRHKCAVKKTVRITRGDFKVVCGDGQAIAVSSKTINQFQNNIAL